VETNYKQVALRIIESMPDDASLDDIMYELYFRQRVDRGLSELEEGKTITHESVKQSLATWLQSFGR
jgi:predicted transcriptional regulator